MSTTEIKAHGELNQTQQEEEPQREKAVEDKLARHGPTGPRTRRGKLKSRYNALKHGIFANVVLRTGPFREKQEDYENLLGSFRESFQPDGGPEELLVEKLAQLAWRMARAVKADAAMVTDINLNLDWRVKLPIPEIEEMDRLLRYETRLEGAFDRTLQQLERLQRMRRGEAVPPTVKVDVVR